MKKQDSSASNDLSKAAEIVKKGGIIIFPTDTVYGIGCEFDNEKAKEKIYKIKNKPQNTPLPVLVSGIKQAENIVETNETARSLINKFWPGALTIVLNSKSGKEKIGVRQPDHLAPLKIIEKSKTPIIGTSANFHNKKPAANMGDLDPDFVKLADFVVLGECKNKAESTVVDATISPPKILRQGVVKLSEERSDP